VQKGSRPVAVEPVFDPRAKIASFRIVEGKTAVARIKPDLGTVRRGNAVSPWAQNQPVEGDYIKREAQAGRMGQQLYALAVKCAGGFMYRAPDKADLDAVAAAEAELAKRLPEWEAKDWVPTEARKEGRADWACEIYGATRWRDTYAPRQILTACTMLEELKQLQVELFDELPKERAAAVMTYLALGFDKAVAYNSRQSGWDPTRIKVCGAFVRHDLSMRWTFGEFDATGNLVPWVIQQVRDAYEGLVALVGSAETLFEERVGRSISIIKGSAADMHVIKTGTVSAICVDPPYYDNVMYAELSDYFYVWLKRILGDVHPSLFQEELTNKDDEAVANKARFKDIGRKADGLAKADYERKMAAAFREMHRVLCDGGVLTVMFTHKQVDAWDTLATSLIGAGFAIKASWPVHTESEHSLHQAKKNAAQSTILLTCRKRKDREEPVWWDDIKGRVREEARAKAAEFEKVGIRGVDLYIATFGPTLAILSEHWPVLSSEVDEKTGDPKPLRPEIALDLAREEVVKLRKQGLLLGRTVQFDPATDWYLMAWDAFKAEAFPGDEARKLAIALGMDLERDVIALKRLVAKKGDMVDIQQPTARRKRDMVDGDKETFDCWVDAVHTAMMLQEEDGSADCKAFLNKTGLMKDSTFKACVQAMINAIPRTKSKGKFVRPEAETLEAMRLAFFDDLVAPAEEEPPKVAVQATFDGEDFAESEGEDEEDNES
jgi:adenine-specific DNA methylase